MGDILEFREFRSRRRSSSDPVPAQGAQILFFLGVRYERHEVVAEVAKAPRKRAPRTDAAAKKRNVGHAAPKRKTASAAPRIRSVCRGPARS